MKTIPAWRDDIKPEYQSIIQIAAPAMQAEIDALRTRLAEVEKDALRYRYIRKHEGAIGVSVTDFTGEELYERMVVTEELDAAIDSAMGAQA